MKHSPALLLFCLVGCSSVNDAGSHNSITSTRSVTEAPRKLSYQEAKSWIANHAGKRYGTFISRGGKLVGMDSDAKLSFISMKEIEITEYGYAPTQYTGTYSVDKDGAIHVRLKDYPSSWNSMHLFSKGSSTFLMPVGRDPAFTLGGRAGAVETPEMAPYWPFVHVYSRD